MSDDMRREPTAEAKTALHAFDATPQCGDRASRLVAMQAALDAVDGLRDRIRIQSYLDAANNKAFVL